MLNIDGQDKDLLQSPSLPGKTMRRHIYRLALPNIISNVTVPLLSMVDVGLAGHLGRPEAVGAIGVASGVISLVYWLFAFLRMGTTGFTAQAYGRSDVTGILIQLCRGLLLAIILGIIIWFARDLMYAVGIFLSAGSQSIADETKTYLQYAFAGAPAALMLYVLNGWFVGMQDTRIPMWVAIGQNVLNILLSLILVKYAGLGVAGLAIGTVSAQYVGVLALLTAFAVKYTRLLALISQRHFVSTLHLAVSMGMGGLLLLRTLLLSGISLFFTYASAKFGANTLAANILLMQLFTLFSYLLDGLAYAGEALAGRYIGQRNPYRFALMRRQLFRIGFFVATAIALLYLLFPSFLLRLLTNDATVYNEAMSMVFWISLIPLCSFAAFLWDGIMVGATASGMMLATILFGAMCFFSCYFISVGNLGVWGLWLSFDLYLLFRSLASWKLGKRLRCSY